MSGHVSSVKQALPETASNEWPMRPPRNLLIPTLPGGQSLPKISIVTPSYNQGSFLEKTIRSVLIQGYPNVEYIIIDGGSTDQSVDIIKKYEPWINFWVSEKDRGQSHAINKGFEKATGVLLGWLNSDDYFLPDALFKMAKAYLEDTAVGLVYGQGHIINQKGKIVYTPELTQVTYDPLFAWSYGNNFMQPSCLFTSQAWQECGPLDEGLHFTMDLDLYLNIPHHPPAWLVGPSYAMQVT